MRNLLTRKLKLFGPVFAVLLLADWSTKRLAVDQLVPHVPREVLGDVVRFTLAYNPGAAFGISLGGASRWAFTLLAGIALALLVWLYRDTRPDDSSRVLALALLMGGAVGNLWDRILSARGVIDFIDVGVGPVRWWTFNIADMGITVGGLLLAWQLWEEDRRAAARASADEAPADAPDGSRDRAVAESPTGG